MKSTVAIARDDDIGASVTGALGLLGDLSGHFAGAHVAIKPNETMASSEDHTACTQPDTLRAVIRYVKGCRPGRITVSGGAGAGRTGEVMRVLGLDRVIEEEGVGFFDHNRPPFEAVALDYGPQEEVMVNPAVLDYDAVVSLSQLKVHDEATVTLTMKNTAMSWPAADYYGYPRARKLHPHKFFKDLHGFIVGMCKRFPITLGIIVGHPAMVGRGPIGGETFETGLTVASTDYVAADKVGSMILGIENVRHIEEAGALGLGRANLEDIEIVGLTLEGARSVFEEKRAGKLS
ncbi:MAG TPA: DUF362 domain-containing protein [Thermodesulfobacteriota bacterium]|nr:DUF362 domain-containing protein [Thermodesulfobacteriota bacterium]